MKRGQRSERLPERTRPPVEQDRIANWVRRHVLAGKLKPGDRLPPRTALTERFEVSNLTVQRAMDQLLEDGFIATRGPAGSFVAERPPHEYCFGLALQPKQHDPSWSNLWDALLAAAARIETEEPFRFATYEGVDTHMDTQDCRRLRRDIERRALAGILFDQFSAQVVERETLDTGDIPVIGIAPTPRASRMPTVSTAPEEFYACALERLKRAGCRDVAVMALANADVWGMMPMLKRRFRKHGLNWRKAWVQGAPLEETGWARQSIRLLFDARCGDRPDGLIVADDNLALCVSQALRELSLRVPGDVRVVALCNYPILPRVDMAFEWVGYDLVNMLRSAIAMFGRLREGHRVPASIRIPAQDYADLGGRP